MLKILLVWLNIFFSYFFVRPILVFYLDESFVKSRSDIAVDWLSDNHVVHHVRDATCGLVDAVSKNAGDTSGWLVDGRSTEPPIHSVVFRLHVPCCG